MLIFDFASKQHTVQNFFQEPVDDEIEFIYLLCKFYILYTWRTKLLGVSNTQIQEHLIVALYNQKIKPGYKKSIQSTIQAASSYQ